MSGSDQKNLLRALAGAAALALASTTACTAASADDAPEATFSWLGTSGWRVDIGDSTLLVDPYVSRFDTGLAEGEFDPTTELTVDTDAVDEHTAGAETVLVTHSHWDHFTDVPHIAEATGARVVGTWTTYNLARAFGVDTAQLAPVKGGEVLDFGDYAVEVVPSLHSRNANYSMAFPGYRDEPPERPETIADLPEGDTLTFQVEVDDGPSVFFMGASDFVERDLEGLEPDVAMVAVPSTDATHAYTHRLMEALDHPATVVPVHWDDFESPLENPVTAGLPDRLEKFVDEVQQVSPGTEVITPEYLTPYTFD
ncbi:MBL fold metallo-hydrolase [Nocardiopsis gilva]|nr:MBL fold metallo-hydrolase [Nocardiopsis gilva]